MWALLDSEKGAIPSLEKGKQGVLTRLEAD